LTKRDVDFRNYFIRSQISSGAKAGSSAVRGADLDSVRQLQRRAGGWHRRDRGLASSGSNVPLAWHPGRPSAIDMVSPRPDFAETWRGRWRGIPLKDALGDPANDAAFRPNFSSDWTLAGHAPGLHWSFLGSREAAIGPTAPLVYESGQVPDVASGRRRSAAEQQLGELEADPAWYETTRASTDCGGARDDVTSSARGV